VDADARDGAPHDADARGAEDAGADAEDLIGESRRRVRAGAIGLIAATIALLALIALAVWFFAFAHNPLLHP
jgi:hypothetical protein